MPDISMCKDEGCPLKLKCHRHEVGPNLLHQSYIYGIVRKEDGTCDYFWPLIKEWKYNKEEK